MRLSCVLYFLMVEKVESLFFGASLVGVEYIGTVSLCSPLISFRFSTCRFALRLVSRLALASCAMPTCVSFFVSLCVSCHPALRSVPPSRSCFSPFVLSLRFAFPVCPWAMVFDMGTVSPCSPLVLPCRAAYLVSFFYIPSRLVRLVLRPVMPCRLVRLVLASCSASRFHCLSVGHGPGSHMGAVSPCLPFIVSSLCLVLGICVPPCMTLLRFRPVRAVLRLAMRAVLRSDMRSALYPACLLASWVMVFDAAPFLLARRSSYAVSCHAVPDDPDDLTRRDEAINDEEE